MIAADVVRGDMPITHWSEPATSDTVLLDVRSRVSLPTAMLPAR